MKQFSSPWEGNRTTFYSLSIDQREEAKNCISLSFTSQMFPLSDHLQESSAGVDEKY